MRKCLLILAMGSAGALAWAQSAPLATLESANTVNREQRRTELRTILQAHRQWEPNATTADGTPAERHLSEQERAEIRQQLRLHRPARAKSQP